MHPHVECSDDQIGEGQISNVEVRLGVRPSVEHDDQQNESVAEDGHEYGYQVEGDLQAPSPRLGNAGLEDAGDVLEDIRRNLRFGSVLSWTHSSSGRPG